MSQLAKRLVRPFVSYCHDDGEMVHDLLRRLRLRLNLAKEFDFESWDDRQILAGEDWKQEIDAAMDRADLGLLFVSFPFLNSSFIVREELPRFLDLAGDKRPIPVGLGRVPFDGSIELHGLAERQFFRGPGGVYYDELDGAERNWFVDALFEEILKICRKYF